MRIIYRTDEYNEFFKNADEQVKTKIAYLAHVLESVPVINSKIAKKLTNTNLYEIRIQVNNEYRILCFTIDHDNITQSKNILFLNAFLKKSTKDYDKEIKKALKILDEWTDQK